MGGSNPAQVWGASCLLEFAADYVMRNLTEVPNTTDSQKLYLTLEEELDKTMEIVITPSSAKASWVLNIKCPFMRDFVDADLRQRSRRGMLQYAISEPAPQMFTGDSVVILFRPGLALHPSRPSGNTSSGFGKMTVLDHPGQFCGWFPFLCYANRSAARRGLAKRLRRKLRAIKNWFTKKFTWKKTGLAANNEWAVIHAGTAKWDPSRRRFEHTLTFRPESMVCGAECAEIAASFRIGSVPPWAAICLHSKVV